MLGVLFMALVMTVSLEFGLRLSDEQSRSMALSRHQAMLNALRFFVQSFSIWSATHPEPSEGEMDLDAIFSEIPRLKLDAEGWRFFRVQGGYLLVTTLPWEPGLREALEKEGGLSATLELHSSLIKALPLAYWTEEGLKSAWSHRVLTSALPAGLEVKPFQLCLYFDSEGEL